MKLKMRKMIFNLIHLTTMTTRMTMMMASMIILRRTKLQAKKVIKLRKILMCK